MIADRATIAIEARVADEAEEEDPRDAGARRTTETRIQAET
jgi:hypothetical protein